MKNGLKDDLQLFYNVSYINQQYYDSLGDYTPNTLTQYIGFIFGGVPNIHWADGYTLG